MSVAPPTESVSKPVSKQAGSVAELADARPLEGRSCFKNEGSSPSAPIAFHLGSLAPESTDAIVQKSGGKTNYIQQNPPMHKRMQMV